MTPRILAAAGNARLGIQKFIKAPAAPVGSSYQRTKPHTHWDAHDARLRDACATAAIEHEVSYRDILSDSREYRVIRARWQVWRHLVEEEGVARTDVAAWFRVGTSALLHAFKTMDREKARKIKPRGRRGAEGKRGG